MGVQVGFSARMGPSRASRGGASVGGRRAAGAPHPGAGQEAACAELADPVEAFVIAGVDDEGAVDVDLPGQQALHGLEGREHDVLRPGVQHLQGVAVRAWRPFLASSRVMSTAVTGGQP